MISQPLEDYIAFMRNSPGFAGNEAIELTDAQGASIDLHWCLGRVDTEELIAGAEAVPLLGRRVPYLRLPIASPSPLIMPCGTILFRMK